MFTKFLILDAWCLPETFDCPNCKHCVHFKYANGTRCNETGLLLLLRSFGVTGNRHVSKELTQYCQSHGYRWTLQFDKTSAPPVGTRSSIGSLLLLLQQQRLLLRVQCRPEQTRGLTRSLSQRQRLAKTAPCIPSITHTRTKPRPSGPACMYHSHLWRRWNMNHLGISETNQTPK